MNAQRHAPTEPRAMAAQSETATESHEAMAHAFRETALCLIGLYQIYQVEPELIAATAQVLSQLCQRHITGDSKITDEQKRRALHDLVDELDQWLTNNGSDKAVSPPDVLFCFCCGEIEHGG